MKTILVPTDFSKTANNARDYAISIAQKLNSQIILLNTYHIAYSGANAGSIMNLEKIALNESQKAMKKESDFLSLSFPELDFKTLCEPGLLLDVIKVMGKKSDVDLIIMGTSGTFGFIGNMIGSNASALIGDLNIPIISVPENISVSYPEKIVVANDLLEIGEENLFSYLNKIAVKKDCFVDFIFVLKEGESAVNKIERLKHFSNVEQFLLGFHVIDSNQNDLIEDIVLKYVSSQKSDLLVLVAHNRSFWENIFHQSVSKNIVKHGALPIMVIPEN
jgi:nucleotide-binding universal stress UspA family protein